MKKRYIIFYILIIAWGLLIIKAMIPSDKLVVAYYEKYTVQPHDSLWKIAEQYNHGDDIRKFIYIIEDNNKISSNLQIGEEILIPILEQR